MEVPENAAFVFNKKIMTNHEMIAFAVKAHRQKELTTHQIKEIMLKTFPNFTEGSIRPNDYATGNKCPCPCAGTYSRIFDRIDRGKYLVL
jgi:hypothetical protein